MNRCVHTYARGLLVVGSALVALGDFAPVRAQRTGSTTLMVRVAPESYLNPSHIDLHYTISGDGSADITSQSHSIAAWVRAAPGQQIRLTARFVPAAGVPGASPVIRWAGAPVLATLGGQAGTCTAGTAEAGATVELVSGWLRSGTLTCAVTFSLASPRALPPGDYRVGVDLSLFSE